MKLYGLKTCDTCRKARKALPAAEFIDVRTDGVPLDLLSAALGEFGEALVNKKSTTWRKLDEAARGLDPLDLLKEEPTLMKRPLIVDGGRMTLGWSAEVEASWS